MKRGKYEAPRKSNPLAVVFWILLIACLILGCILLFRSCGKEDPSTTPAPQASVQTQPSQTPTTTPTTEPATQPVTTPPTEPVVTEPATEPVTEPTTEPETEPTTVPTEPEDTTTDHTFGLAVVATAKDALGKPYGQGGAGPDSFDTSGLITYCFREHGVSLSHKTSSQFAVGEEVPKESLQAGDVVFFYQENPGKAEYVGIYTGEGTFIAVSSSQNAVVERSFVSTYYTEHFVGARRYTPNP